MNTAMSLRLSAVVSTKVLNTPTRRGVAVACARATSGQDIDDAAAAPARSETTSRRFSIRSSHPVLGECSTRRAQKLAYPPEVAQADIIPSQAGCPHTGVARRHRLHQYRAVGHALSS